MISYDMAVEIQGCSCCPTSRDVEDDGLTTSMPGIIKAYHEVMLNRPIDAAMLSAISAAIREVVASNFPGMSAFDGGDDLSAYHEYARAAYREIWASGV